MRYLLLLLAIILHAGFCQALSDFKEGFVVTNSMDTIEGFLNNKGNLKNLKRCQFKKTLDDPVTTYTPEQIRAFRIYNVSFYESMEIELAEGKETVFIEKLVE